MAVGTISVNVVANTGQATRKISMFGGQIGRLGNVAGGMGGMLKSATAAMLGYGSAAVAATVGIRSLANAHEDFNQKLNSSLAIMGNVSSQMRDKLAGNAIDVASVTKFSAAQTAEAYLFLASSGMNAAQSMKALPAVAQFAQAGNFDLAMATQLATQSLSAMGLKVNDPIQNLKNLKRVTDNLTMGNILATGEVEDFAAALANGAGAAARMVGMEIEEVVAVLAAFHEQGIMGEEAGTGFAIVMRDMQTQAIANAAAFREAGVAVFDNVGNMRGMADILKDLETKLTGASDAQKKMTLQQLGFTDKSVKFTQMLVGTSEKIRDWEAALQGAGGKTDEVASKQLTVMQKALAKLGAEWTRLAEASAPVFDGFAAFVRVAADVVGGLRSMGSGVGSVLDGFRAIKGLAIGATFLATATAIVGVSVAAAQLVIWLKAVAASQAVTLALSGPKGWAILAAGLVIASGAAYGIAKGFDEVEASAQRAADQATSVMEATEKTAEATKAAADMSDAFGESEERAAEAAKKLADMMDRGKSLAEEMRNPFEIYRDTIAEANELLLAGAISIETFNRANMKAQETLEQANEFKNQSGSRDTSVSAAVRGTSSGYDAVVKTQQFQQRQLELEKQQIAHQAETNRQLSLIQTNTKQTITVNKVRI